MNEYEWKMNDCPQHHSQILFTHCFFTIHIIIAFFRIFLSYLYVGMCTRVHVPLEGVKCPRARGPKWL